MRPRRRFAVTLLLMLLLQGCGASVPSATRPASTSTRPASSATLPGGRASITPSPRPSLGTPPLEAPGWEGVVVRVVCLDVRLSLTDAAIESAVEQGIKDTLQRFGIETVEAAGSCDATIAVALTGKALSARYKDSGWCYTGAEISGTVTLQGGSRSPARSAIELTQTTPYLTSSCPRTPRESSLCMWSALEIFKRVVNLWDSSVMAADPTPNKFNWSLPTFSVLVGGRTSTMGYLSWCKPLATAS